MNQISIVPADHIRNHLANNSKAKVAYQFSKSKRFIQPNPQCPVAFYTNKGELSKRKASFGYGNKSDFTKTLTVSPASTAYHHKSLFEQSRNKGKSFGLSRQKSPDRSYLIPQLEKIPGPGQYQNQFQTRMNTSYTMRPKTIDMIGKHLTFKQAPGPGTYESVELEPKNGRFMYSKFGDSKLAKITNLGPRFTKIKDTPGPLSYLEGDSLSPRGKYVLSNHQGRGTRPFNQTARSSFTDQFAKNKANPAPTQYQKPSQFGVYGDSKYYKTLGSFKSTIE